MAEYKGNPGGKLSGRPCLCPPATSTVKTPGKVGDSHRYFFVQSEGAAFWSCLGGVPSLVREEKTRGPIFAASGHTERATSHIFRRR